MATPGIWRQESFSGGELSPDLYGRTDTIKYATGLATCRNMIVDRSGSVTARPGTKYIGATESGARLVKFIFNYDDTMLLEFINGYVRFYRDGVLQRGEQWVSCSVSKLPTPWEVTLTSHGYSTGDTVEFENSTAVASAVITVVNANKFTLNGTVSGGAVTVTTKCRRSAYVGGGELPEYKLPSPYTGSQVSEFDYAQSGDVLYIAHKNVLQKTLTRTALTNWSFADAAVVPAIAAPTGVSSSSAGTSYFYVITAIASSNYEESIASSSAGSSTTTSTISWSPVTGAREYNVYRSVNGKYGYIGTSTATTFLDLSINPDYTVVPPETTDWRTDDGYPSSVAFYQQRLLWAGNRLYPSKVHASRVGLFNNYSFSFPLQDDDAVTFSLVGRYVPAIKHLAEVGTLFAFTNIGEWVIRGDSDGVITPTTINARQISYNGSGTLRPIVYDSTVIYQQARGNILRDLDYSNDVQSYKGRDLTIFSTHMFEYHTSVSWDYAQTPDSIIWVCRDDGVLLGQTYMKEHDVWGWHRHDTEYGYFQDVCCLPEGGSDATYFVVRRYREFGGLTYESFNIERLMDNIDPANIPATWRVDNGIEYDGHMLKYDGTISTATLSYDHLEGVTSDSVSTLTSDVPLFTSTEVGNSYVLVDSSGAEWWLDVVGYVDSSNVRVRPKKDRPSLFNDDDATTIVSEWYRAVDTVTDTDEVLLYHDNISALCDYDAFTGIPWSGGVMTFPRTYKRILVGIAIQSEMVTLPLDQKTRTANTIVDKLVNFSTVDVQVKSSRSVKAGPDLDHLESYPMRQSGDFWEPNELITGKITVQIDSNWYDSGQIAIKQTDPLPLTVLSISPGGRIG